MRGGRSKSKTTVTGRRQSGAALTRPFHLVSTLHLSPLKPHIKFARCFLETWQTEVGMFWVGVL